MKHVIVYINPNGIAGYWTRENYFCILPENATTFAKREYAEKQLTTLMNKDKMLYVLSIKD